MINYISFSDSKKYHVKNLTKNKYSKNYIVENR